MSEKIPRLKPHESIGPFAMTDLQRLGARMYHYASRFPEPPLRPAEARQIGQMSLTDGVPVIHEAPEPEVLQMDVEAERPGNAWNWSR